jgi:microcystin-dependent protein
MSNLTQFRPHFGPGHMRYFATDAAPAGYLKCDGSVVSQATYPKLYSAVGLIPDAFTHSLIASTTATSAPVYGNGIIVASSGSGFAISSTNGVNWVRSTTGTVTTTNNVVYGNGIFVQSVTNQLRTSTNGINWVSSATTTHNHKVIYGAGLFVTFTSQAIRNSTNGINWAVTLTAGTTAGQPYQRGGYSSGSFVIRGLFRCTTSTDGSNWTTRPAGLRSAPETTDYGDGANGKFFFGGDSDDPKINLYYDPPDPNAYGPILMPFAGRDYALSTANVGRHKNWQYIDALKVHTLPGLKLHKEDSDNSIGIFSGYNKVYGVIASADFKTFYLPPGLNTTLYTSSLDQWLGLVYAYGKYIATRATLGIYEINPYSYNTATEFALPIVNHILPVGYSPYSPTLYIKT